MDERCQDKQVQHLVLCALNMQLRLNTKAYIMGTNVSLMLATLARCWFPCLRDVATGGMCPFRALIVKCLTYLNTQFSPSGTVWEGWGTFRKYSLPGGSWYLEAGLYSSTLLPVHPSLPNCECSVTCWLLSVLPPCLLCLWHIFPTMMDDVLANLKLKWALFPLPCCFLSGFGQYSPFSTKWSQASIRLGRDATIISQTCFLQINSEEWSGSRKASAPQSGDIQDCTPQYTESFSTDTFWFCAILLCHVNQYLFLICALRFG